MSDFGSAAILAGGKSTRMGFDKQLIEIGGRRLMETLIAALKEDFPEVLVISSCPELYEGLGVRVRPDILPDNGLLGGIHAALSHAASRYVYVIACDMPHLNPFYIDFMKGELRRTGAEICLTRNGAWIEPMNAFYAKELVPALEEHLAGVERSVYSFVRKRKTHYVEEPIARRFCPDYRMFLNLNTVEDLRFYADRLAGDGQPPVTTVRPIEKYRDGVAQTVGDPVVVEYPLTITVNGREFVTLLCTPSSLRELVVGHLFSDGVVNGKEEVADLALNAVTGSAAVMVKGDGIERRLRDRLAARRAVTSGCGRGTMATDTLERIPDAAVSRSGAPVTVATIAALMAEFNKRSQVFIETGGVHSCALADGSGILLFQEDIGRHNALDKVIGQALLEDIPFDGKLVLTSGRISSEIVAKLARCRPFAVVSRSAPTGAAVDMARGLGMGLAGFARGKNLNVYTGFELFATGETYHGT